MEIITKATKDYTWAQLKEAAENGTISDLLHSGDLIPFTLKNGEIVAVRVAHAKGKMFFVLEDCLNEEHVMNDTATTAGGWADTEMRRYLNEEVFALLPDDLQAVIAPTKIVQIVDGERVETEDRLFLFSMTQVFGIGPWTQREPEDVQLDCFIREKDRVKECGDSGTWFWWLRSAISATTFYSVYTSGNYSNNIANVSYGVALGFCLI